jgi:peptide/nickel transport system permease protein
MLYFIARRITWSIPILFFVSLVSFLIVQAPPGDFVSALTAALIERGDSVDYVQLEALRERYGLDQPVYIQYWRWISVLAE